MIPHLHVSRSTFHVLLPLLALALPPAPGKDLQTSIRRVHSRFTGKPGTFAQFGDSITVTQAYWSPLRGERRNAPPEMERAFRLVNQAIRPECWSEWKGPQYGSEGGQTAQWANEHVDEWLRRLNPEVALIMFGTNDLRDTNVDVYRNRMGTLVRKCLDNGTVVIVSTIPPRHGEERKAAAFAAAVRGLARELEVPLIDFQVEILKRRPDDWDGALPKFAAFEGYEVPTLISRDGVHPSFPKQYQNDYSPEALRNSGYGLRSYLTLLKYAEVVEALRPDGPQTTDHRRQVTDDRPRTTADGMTVASCPSSVVRGLSSDVRGPSSVVRGLPSPHDQPWFPKAPPLPAPRGDVIRVANVRELYDTAARARPGETIMVAEGRYLLPGPLEIRTHGVTLRGASGRRERVVLDAGGQGEAVRFTACTGVTIADLTVQNVRWNGIKINSETGVQRLTIYNCILHNIWQRFIKGVAVPEKDRDRLRPTACRVTYCLFYNDRPKQFSDDDADTPATFNGNYIGGIDVMFARNWTIRGNVFTGIHGRTREARGCVFLWHDAQGCIVERNVILDCDTGIALGNSFRPAGITVHATGCIVRNNFITRAPEGGIVADYTSNCQILNNSIYEPHSQLGRLIRLVHDNDGLRVMNNLLCGPDVRNESRSRIDIRNNLAKDLTPALVDPAHGNLHLTPRAVSAIHHALPLPDVRDDIDGMPRGPKPDIGAHELG